VATAAQPAKQAKLLVVEDEIAWKASPRFLTTLADAEREAQDDLEDFP
jgi:hypothetical protein